LTTFVIVGGGPTGVEMAGAIAELAQHALASDFRSIDPRADPHHAGRRRAAICSARFRNRCPKSRAAN
jgi:hypothetical protein